MTVGKMVEVPVVCHRCRRVYRQAKIVPITPSPSYITGTCNECQSFGSADYDGQGERRNTLGARRKSRSAMDSDSGRSSRGTRGQQN